MLIFAGLSRLMRHFFCVAACSATLLAPAASAAIITLDLRVAGGGKAAQVAAANNAVQLELYAVIQNNDNNRANDAFQLAHGALLSIESGTGLQGNLLPLTLNTPFMDTILANPGATANLDGNADLEVGGLNTESVTGWLQLSTGNAAKFGTGSGTGGTEFLLGTTSWTYSGLGVNPTALNFSARVRTTGSVSAKQLFKGVSDGTVFSFDAGTSLEVAVGTPVNVSAIPEPGTYALGAMLLTGLAGWKLRRKKS